MWQQFVSADDNCSCFHLKPLDTETQKPPISVFTAIRISDRTTNPPYQKAAINLK
jgi:hypothetical protein